MAGVDGDAGDIALDIGMLGIAGDRVVSNVALLA